MKSHDEVRDLRVLTHAEVAMSSSAAAAIVPSVLGGAITELVKAFATEFAINTAPSAP
jgi:hypothetical protein